MSEMKMENSRVPAEKIFNPDLKEAIVNMQEDNSKENVDKMIISSRQATPGSIPRGDAPDRNTR